MAKNTGKGFRQGSVDNRSQFYNQHNNTWNKRNTETGEIMDVSKDPFKGVAREPDDRRD